MYFKHLMPECNLLFGKNTLSQVGKITKQWGDNVLLVTGKRSMVQMVIYISVNLVRTLDGEHIAKQQLLNCRLLLEPQYIKH